MTIFYRLVPVRNPKTGARVARPVPVYRGRSDAEHFVQRVADGSTVGEADVAAVLVRAAQVMADELLRGAPVRLPQLGMFHLTLLYEPVEAERFDVRKHFKGVRVRFRPDPRFLARLQGLELKRPKPGRRRRRPEAPDAR